MQRVFRIVSLDELTPAGVKTTAAFIRNVRRHGVITPILVAEVPDADGVIRIEIIDGNRRVRAAKAAGLEVIPAVVLRETSVAERARLTLICNYLRSNNFHTESQALTSTADSEDGVRRLAKSLDLGVAKLVTMFRKVEAMPPEVRAAMYEERLPVSSAMAIAGWPASLQQEIVALLARRRRLQTWQIKAARESWEARFGPVSGRPAARPATPVAAPRDDWHDAAPVVIDAAPRPARAPMPPVTPPQEPEAPERPAPPPESRETPSQAPAIDGTSPGTMSPPRTGLPRPASAVVQVVAPASPPEATGATRPPEPAPSPGFDEPEDAATALRATVAELDANLQAAAVHACRAGLTRAVWIDRAVRAWERAEMARTGEAG